MKRSASLRRSDGMAKSSVPAPRTKKCKACREPFVALRPLQSACSPACAHALASKLREKRERAENAARREKLKTRRDWLRECQVIANKIARLRDKSDPCISCERPANWEGQWHGSHFRSVGAASAVRLNLWNIHKACSICNHHLSGNVAEYEPRLRLKIGDEKVDWLRGQNQRVNYDIAYLKRYKKVMGKKLRRMEKRLKENT
jgi:hypothetical protein